MYSTCKGAIVVFVLYPYPLVLVELLSCLVCVYVSVCLLSSHQKLKTVRIIEISYQKSIQHVCLEYSINILSPCIIRVLVFVPDFFFIVSM